jgi:hypothetical protein
MATEFEIQGPTRVCAATGRELAPGDRFYAALTDEAGKFVRRDFAADAWPGPPPGAVAHWAGRVPASDRPRKPTFNDDLLLDCFRHLAEAAELDRVNFRYVVALLLMRRKRLKFEDARQRPDGSAVLVVRDAKSGSRHEVADPRLSAADVEAVQAEVFRVLGWE